MQMTKRGAFGETNCKKCGSPFIRPYASSKYCSSSCSNRGYRTTIRRGEKGICLFCEKPFRVWHNTQKQKFCSLSCWMKYARTHKIVGDQPRKRIEVICDGCGQKFGRPPCWWKKNKVRFCCNACKGRWQARQLVQVECVVCSKKFVTNVCNRTRVKYCSHFCQRKANPKKRNSRKARRVADLTECQKCGYKEHPEILQAHHKNKDRTDDTPENIIVLCPNCHALEHRS